jgi:hypothetical protein
MHYYGQFFHVTAPNTGSLRDSVSHDVTIHISSRDYISRHVTLLYLVTWLLRIEAHNVRYPVEVEGDFGEDREGVADAVSPAHDAHQGPHVVVPLTHERSAAVTLETGKQTHVIEN